MAQRKSEISALLAGQSVAPQRRLGQNFMIDQNLVRAVAAAGEIKAGDVVIEVGPGTGSLTEELLASAAEKIIAVEIDRGLARILRDRLADNPRLVLIEGDALSGKHELNAELLRALPAGGGFKLVANLPYNMASPLVIELLLAGARTLAFTVQKEVAERIRAGAGTESYGPLSVMVQLLAKVEWLRVLPPQAFWPAPKIQSVLLRLNRNDRLGDRAGDLGRFIHKIFSSRRKMLRNSLTMAGVTESAMNKLKIDVRKRPEEFSPEELLSLFEAISASAAEARADRA